MRDMDQLRQWMKSDFAGRSRERSDQQKGLPYPPLQKEVPAQPAGVIDLPAFDPGLARGEAFPRLVVSRESRRQYNAEPLSLEELAFLLYATQGVKEELGRGYVTRRTVPSAGARHPFETYLAVNRVDELEPGLYRYLPLSHQLLLMESTGNLPGLLTAASLGQSFVGDAACVFLWSCLPYRAEWRYQHHAHKNMLLDAGHIGQNLYLAVEALGLGTCAVGAYDQRAVDTLLELDGEDEFVVYLAPVSRV